MFRSIHSVINRGRPIRGLEEFYEMQFSLTKATIVGRAWMMSDLRRKSFDDLHKLWFILYKERNLLLTIKARSYRLRSKYLEERRYMKVKLSMANVKRAIAERERLLILIDKQSNPSLDDKSTVDDDKKKKKKAKNGGLEVRWKKYREAISLKQTTPP